MPFSGAEIENLNTHYTGRPSPLYFAERPDRCIWAARKIYFKRDELNHHRFATRSTIVWGRSFWRAAWARTRIIAETGAGQHGVATATVCARFGLPCVVYMGAHRCRAFKAPQRLPHEASSVRRSLPPYSSGHGTLKDAMNEALRDWVTNCRGYLLPDPARRPGTSFWPAPLSRACPRLPVA